MVLWTCESGILESLGDDIFSDISRFGGPGRRFALSRFEIVTWLILPVVICLSQRLSHACLSINKFIR
ncbi:hypothetical protein BCR39DRAFT_84982 [Naematelia encephala]|uniref:Uncharacterized protein n=1 Tax=Naematelia encephala TaxID=71784 RepID=A0A1Y2ACR7_9TREE|nr:hypothetical protein BCR39DRAFT_84982 [Naematelia encephala]